MKRFTETHVSESSNTMMKGRFCGWNNWMVSRNSGCHWAKSVRIQENTDKKKLRISTLFTEEDSVDWEAASRSRWGRDQHLCFKLHIITTSKDKPNWDYYKVAIVVVHLQSFKSKLRFYIKIISIFWQNMYPCWY